MPRDDERSNVTLDLFERAPLLPIEPLCIVEAMKLWPRDLVKEAAGVVRVASEVADMLAERGCLRPVRHGQRGNFSARYMLVKVPS